MRNCAPYSCPARATGRIAGRRCLLAGQGAVGRTEAQRECHRLAPGPSRSASANTSKSRIDSSSSPAPSRTASSSSAAGNAGVDDQGEVEQHRRERRDLRGRRRRGRRERVEVELHRARCAPAVSSAAIDPRMQFAGVADDRAVQDQLGASARMPRRDCRRGAIASSARAARGDHPGRLRPHPPRSPHARRPTSPTLDARRRGRRRVPWLWWHARVQGGHLLVGRPMRRRPAAEPAAASSRGRYTRPISNSARSRMPRPTLRLRWRAGPAATMCATPARPRRSG